MTADGPRILLGVSLKMYFSHAHTLEWAHSVSRILSASPAVTQGLIEFFVVPTYPALREVVQILQPNPVGAQNVASTEQGAFTGEVSAAELAEIGVSMVEIGHAERRSLLGETDADIAAKCSLVMRHGMTPIICVGEAAPGNSDDAASVVVSQVDAALALVKEQASTARVVVAYEPHWAIGAQHPAPAEYVRKVCGTAKDELTSRYQNLVLLYGGSAGPGTLNSLCNTVDGLFLGRFVHDPRNVSRVIDEATNLIEQSHTASMTN
ncbi:triose-phosphate isomerase family protein [Propionibacterium sp.]|uniref:triose-phosphate isomerase family protein n=1 Tax=Propionibacterium sp. TaxID=1977903 RepID=UPI0039EC4CD1